MTMPVGMAEQKELTRLLEKTKGNDEAEAHVERVLKAVSGKGGMHNVSAILGDRLTDAVKEAGNHKAAGNAAFAEGNFEDALDLYQRALDLFDHFEPTLLLHDAAAKQVMVTCFCNSAQACLKLGTGDDVQRGADGARMMAEKALTLDPSNIKARFRRGCAYALVQDWTLAQADFEGILRVEPENDAAKRELRNVLKQLRNGKQRVASGAPSSWEKAASAVVNDDPDPRVARTEKAATVALVEKQVFMAAQVRKAVLAFYDSKGCLEEWQEKMEDFQVNADSLAEHMLEQISEISRRDWANCLGPKGEVLLTLDTEQRRAFIEADAFVTTMKEACGHDFAEIVNLASSLS